MNYKLEFTVEEVKVILNALSRLPYDQVAKFIETIVQQINTQEASAKKGDK
jgi:uncharacterized protein YjgD (DUF1641 family)